MKNTRRPNPRGIFAGMDEDSYQKLKKLFAVDKRETRRIVSRTWIQTS